MQVKIVNCVQDAGFKYLNQVLATYGDGDRQVAQRNKWLQDGWRDVETKDGNKDMTRMNPTLQLCPDDHDDSKGKAPKLPDTTTKQDVLDLIEQAEGTGIAWHEVGEAVNNGLRLSNKYTLKVKPKTEEKEPIGPMMALILANPLAMQELTQLAASGGDTEKFIRTWYAANKPQTPPSV
jgi:hypothetical protein